MSKQHIETPDLSIPGIEIEVPAEKAESLGVFEETALTEEEARETWIDENEVNRGE